MIEYFSVVHKNSTVHGFLADVLWHALKYKALRHNSVSCDNWSTSLGFPQTLSFPQTRTFQQTRQGFEYVGQQYDENQVVVGNDYKQL